MLQTVTRQRHARPLVRKGTDDLEEAKHVRVSKRKQTKVSPPPLLAPLGVVCGGPCPDLFVAIRKRIAASCGLRFFHSLRPRVDAAPMAARRQGKASRCAASAWCSAVFLRLLFQCNDTQLLAMRDRDARPSVAHAYHKQRWMGAKAKHRSCVCSSVTHLCEDRGTPAGMMHKTFEHGVCTERVWPACLSNDNTTTHAGQLIRARVRAMVAASVRPGFLDGQAAFRVVSAKYLSSSSPTFAREVLRSIRCGCPVVASFLRFRSQAVWSVSQWHDAAVTGADDHAAGTAASHVVAIRRPWHDDMFTMPPPKPFEKPLRVLHTMVITAYDSATQKFRVRNSRGERWGCGGDFAVRAVMLGRGLVEWGVSIKHVTLSNCNILSKT